MRCVPCLEGYLHLSLTPQCIELADELQHYFWLKLNGPDPNFLSQCGDCKQFANKYNEVRGRSDYGVQVSPCEHGSRRSLQMISACTCVFVAAQFRGYCQMTFPFLAVSKSSELYLRSGAKLRALCLERVLRKKRWASKKISMGYYAQIV